VFIPQGQRVDEASFKGLFRRCPRKSKKEKGPEGEGKKEKTPDDSLSGEKKGVFRARQFNRGKKGAGGRKSPEDRQDYWGGLGGENIPGKREPIREKRKSAEEGRRRNKGKKREVSQSSRAIGAEGGGCAVGGVGGACTPYGVGTIHLKQELAYTRYGHGKKKEARGGWTVKKVRRGEKVWRLDEGMVNLKIGENDN